MFLQSMESASTPLDIEEKCANGGRLYMMDQRFKWDGNGFTYDLVIGNFGVRSFCM